MAAAPEIPEQARRIFETHLRQLQRVVASQGQRGLRKLYKEALADLTLQLARAPRGGSTETQLRAMVAQVEVVLAALGKKLNRHLEDVSKAAAELGAEHGLREFKDLSQIAGTEPVLSLENAAVFRGTVRGTSRSLLRRHRRQTQAWTLSAIDAMERQLSVGVLAGRPIEDQITAISGVAGIGEQERWKAERIVRTEIMNAHGATKFAAMKRTQEDIGRPLWKKLIETFDDRTGDDSFVVHGQTVPLDKPFTWKSKVRGVWVLKAYMHPPNRPNDRAVVIPWDPEWGPGLKGFERALTKAELKSARPTRWRDHAGVDIPPGHRPGESYRGKVRPPPPPEE